MGKPQCIHFLFQIHITCVFHSHVATNLKKLQFVLSITLHNKQVLKKKSFNTETVHRWSRLCWVRLGVRGFLCRFLACSCAVEAGVIQAVSGSCDQKHSAQQLETTYVTQLLYESSKYFHGGQSGWNYMGEHSEGYTGLTEHSATLSIKTRRKHIFWFSRQQ